MSLLLLPVNLTSCSAEKGNKDFTNDIKSDFSLDDLNFDPAAIIGEGSGDWSVSVTSMCIFFLSPIFVVWFNFLISVSWSSS